MTVTYSIYSMWELLIVSSYKYMSEYISIPIIVTINYDLLYEIGVII